MINFLLSCLLWTNPGNDNDTWEALKVKKGALKFPPAPCVLYGK